MAYQLQPGLSIVQNSGALPPVNATDEVFVYPQPSGLNCGGCRPNTMLYGTAPYKAGKGAPAQYVDVSDRLRPQSTSRFNKHLVETYDRNYFPLNNVECKLPIRSISYEPASTRAELQNDLFQQRYLNKNVNRK
mgnify:FL=1|jgi:hypothetical protein|tara:strand:+ start:2012 stop:2413 length:402 start_codon:yes stop_codon:yes gene_type:complete